MNTNGFILGFGVGLHVVGFIIPGIGVIDVLLHAVGSFLLGYFGAVLYDEITL